tara:strand:- start:40 stop:870 length:831 start_codon:yes stop_codon:yes gene_type:complete
MKNICASCRSIDVIKIVKTDNNKIPKWLSKVNYVDNFINNVPLKLYKQKKTNMKLKLNVGKQNKNKYMLYWAAKSSKNILIKDAKKAYGNFSNYGVSKVDNNGDVMLCFDCPQPYSTIEKGKTNKETFYRHIHFCFSNKFLTNWLSSVYTKIIMCELNLEETMKLHNKGLIVLINALPGSYYSKSHIPNSYNLHNKEIRKMSQNELFNWFEEVIKLNYPVLYDYIKKKKLNLYEIPIVVYCAHKNCNAGYLSGIELLKKGFVNVSDFKGGMLEYLK